MSYDDIEQQQEQNTAKLVMNTFYKVATEDGATATDITKYLLHKFGNVWKVSNLVEKAENALKTSATLGFLNRYGDRYMVNAVREAGCCCKRRRRRRTRKRRCGRKKRRRRRRKRCCCCKC